jgi:hypothetical protein
MTTPLQAYLNENLMTAEELRRRTHKTERFRLNQRTIYKAIKGDPIREENALKIVHATRGKVPLNKINIYQAWTKGTFDGH